MSHYYIIDSNKPFAKKLYRVLNGSNDGADSAIIDTSTCADVSTLVTSLVSKMTSGTVILINAETKLKDKYSQHQAILELIFWFRCKYKWNNLLVIYSCVSVDHSLKQNPQNFVILSPNCIYLRLPITMRKVHTIKQYKTTEDFDIKPFLKPAINLANVRHRYANYTGISLMHSVALVRHPDFFYSEVIENSALNIFKESLDFHLLEFYFNLDRKNLSVGGTNVFIPQTKKILLVDDLANDGWQSMISLMLYGRPDAPEIESLTLHKDNSQLDIEKTIIGLKDHINKHKPHLILLDLRLNDNEDKHELHELDGYKILTELKNSSEYKGVPVVMFTASNNVQTIKRLIDCGAYNVWTKPGIDEGLNSKSIVERYDQLVQLANSIFNPNYKLLNQINDTEDEKFDANAINFEEIRNLLLKKLEFIKYRVLLNNETQWKNIIPEPFASADAIYIDANALITGERTMYFQDIISSVYKLAILTHRSTFSYFTPNRKLDYKVFPKVVIMNCVFDEIIKIAKISTHKIETKRNGKFRKHDLRFFRALIAQLVIKELFNNEFVRTEFDKYNPTPEFKLKNPKENVHADGHIIDEISSVVMTSRNFSSMYSPSTKVVFVTGDNRLKERIQAFGSDDNLTVLCRECLTYQMSQVAI